MMLRAMLSHSHSFLHCLICSELQGAWQSESNPPVMFTPPSQDVFCSDVGWAGLAPPGESGFCLQEEGRRVCVPASLLDLKYHFKRPGASLVGFKVHGNMVGVH